MTLDQVFGLYNYWIVIFLMMIGFYIVIARENFIKTIIGLNIFQISVILLYITMGKVDGGTAPIIPPETVARYAAAHHDSQSHDSQSHDLDPSESSIEGSRNHNDDSHETEKRDGVVDQFTNSPESASLESERSTSPARLEDDEASLNHSHDYAAETAMGASLSSGDIKFSNPLPSVLMLTAIVVGVATTALALALIVRIREDYGTIEENEVLELDRKS